VDCWACGLDDGMPWVMVWGGRCGMVDDHDGCGWVNVSSGTCSSGLSQTKSREPLNGCVCACMCVCVHACVHVCVFILTVLDATFLIHIYCITTWNNQLLYQTMVVGPTGKVREFDLICRMVTLITDNRLLEAKWPFSHPVSSVTVLLEMKGTDPNCGLSGFTLPFLHTPSDSWGRACLYVMFWHTYYIVCCLCNTC